MSLLKAVVSGNEAQKEHTAAKIRRLLGGSVSGKTVAILGVAFKAETDDIRESLAITVVKPASGIGSWTTGPPSASTTPKLSTISRRSSPTRLPVSTTSLSASPAPTAR
jgi:hypothetical protein